MSAGVRNQVLRIAVSDEGGGFPDGFIGDAFDRFTRADQTRSTRGSGLGLALVKAVAEAHGGTATIENASNPTRIVIEIATDPV